MRARVLVVSFLVAFLLAGASFAGVTVTAEDGAKLRIDAAKFVKITESAIRRAAPNAAVNVSIVIGPPEVSTRTFRGSMGRGNSDVVERLRARYTITDANGVMLETRPFLFHLGHGGTLDYQLGEIRDTADYIAWRAAALTR